MAITINQYNCAGNLTRDIELKTGGSGTAFANCGIAITERVKNGSGQYEDETQFFDFTMFGKLAERCAEHLKKGDTIYLSGRLKTEKWEKDGQKHKAVKIIAQDVVFIRWGRDRKDSTPAPAGGEEKAPF